ncbi:hypothetical protein [Aureivirga marina]|uniref:hypothetical protein n=1 Tax=Aureivirga marina TaxID=1182451 RepID=UPI0018C91C0B|nr:hypothetical protein [Aureivirga marina]
MKNRILNTLLFCFIGLIGFSQTKTENSFLQIPKNWTYEKIEFPLGFATDITYDGFEELRFSPEMFKLNKEHYFTYIFALVLEGNPVFEEKELTDFLEKYYKGLADAVARGKEQKIDLNEIKIRLINKEGGSFVYEIDFLDTFTNGQKIQLKMEIEVYTKKKEKVVLALVSANESEKVWKELYGYKKEIEANLHR